MVLDNISFDDNYTSGYDEKRVIIHTLDFTAKTYLFGPVADNSEGLIKRVQVDYATNTNRKETTRSLLDMLQHLEHLKTIMMITPQHLQRI